MQKGLLFVVLALAGCQGGPPPVVNATPVTLTAAQVKSVEDGIKVTLKDPTSAIFGKMVAGRDAAGDLAVCGYVNARNSLGGYVGAQPFEGTLIGPNFDLRGVSRNADAATRGAVLTECYRRGLIPKDIPIG